MCSKMKIGILSDLHVEFETYDEEFPECDVLVLAGDIHDASDYLSKNTINRKISSFNGNIVQIGGNHEGYGGTIEDLSSETSMVVHNGVRFIYSTGWSYPTEYAWRGMNDGMYIGGNNIDLIHEYSNKNWLEIEYLLNMEHDGKTVVVTHYLPTPQSIHTMYTNSNINSGFMIDKTDLIEKYQPDLWIHGHTHSSFDYMIGDTRIVCNPRGYSRSGVCENSDFNPKLVVEI